MNPTLPLFHQQPYLQTVQCQIHRLERDDSGAPFALLSETVFYPQGGGQLGDRGLLTLSEPGAGDVPQVIEITTTKRKDDEIRHYLKLDDAGFGQLQSLVPGQMVTATLDWSLRYQQMRIHSAMHLMHCLLEQTLGRSIPHPVRSPLNDQGGENHYEFMGEFDEQSLERATQELNRFCAAGHAVRTQADTGKGPGYRWWQCGEWSIPCGGVHVGNTREIGAVTASMKIRKNTTRVAVTLAAGAE